MVFGVEVWDCEEDVFEEALGGGGGCFRWWQRVEVVVVGPVGERGLGGVSDVVDGR